MLYRKNRNNLFIFPARASHSVPVVVVSLETLDRLPYIRASGLLFTFKFYKIAQIEERVEEKTEASLRQ